jgi:hypothetical protein
MSSNLLASMYIYKIMMSSSCLVIGGMTASEDDEAHSVPSYVLPRHTSLDTMQKRKVKERLQAICSEIPIYVLVVKNTNISGRSRAMVS